MSTRAQRKERANARRCVNCGEFGKHFYPPSAGTEGGYICKPSGTPEERRRRLALRAKHMRAS